MKKLGLFAAVAVMALAFASCGETDYTSFVGTWGVEKIEYYNIDYAGNPIAASMESVVFDADDIDNGIQLVFREDKTGEMRDSAIDTVWIENEETGEYDTYIYNPDTVMVNTFTYSYDENASCLYMNMRYTYPYTYTKVFMMKVSNMTDDSFVYENEYYIDYMERAYLKRLSDEPTKSASRQTPKRLHKHGSLMSDK